MIARADGQTIAMAITIPDIHQVYKRMQGACCLGVVGLLNRGRIIDPRAHRLPRVLPEFSTPAWPRRCTRAFRYRRAHPPEGG